MFIEIPKRTASFEKYTGIYTSGKSLFFYFKGLYHRLDGPAFINNEEKYSEYYLFGKQYSKKGHEYYKVALGLTRRMR